MNLRGNDLRSDLMRVLKNEVNATRGQDNHPQLALQSSFYYALTSRYESGLIKYQLLDIDVLDIFINYLSRYPCLHHLQFHSWIHSHSF